VSEPAGAASAGTVEPSRTPAPPPRPAVTWPVLLVLIALLGWGVWSYSSGGLVHALFGAAADGDRSLETLRLYLDRAGAFGPLLYVLAVTIEVIVAPLPGTLLYAPAGAIFGGGLGGTLSLAGNVAGAMLAATIARMLGHRLTERLEHSQLQRHTERIRSRGLLIIALLRVNPLTSSDLVSYAAGLVGVPVWRVGLGTLVGMAPLCYAQAYAAETLFRWLPGSGLVVLALGLAYLVVVIVLILRLGRARR
jgi:uncharacterized membrane protein YdjX (TVP38/TMEM64 family)